MDKTIIDNQIKSVFFLTYNHCEDTGLTQKSLLKQLRENFRKSKPNPETGIKTKIVYYIITKEEYRDPTDYLIRSW